MLADDAPAMDAPAFLAAGMSNAAPAFRPQLTLGAQPSAAVLLLEITSRAEGAPTPEPPPTPSIVTSGLVMHLDAGNAASYPGTGTAWNDLSGNGNNLTAINSPTWNPGGWFSTGATGYFTRATGIALPQGNDAYTMQAWVRRASWGSAQGVMSIGGSGVANRANGIFTLNSMVGHFRHYWWGNDLDATNNNAALALNVWFLVTARFDGTTRSLLANTTPVASDTPAGHNVTSPLIEVARTNVGLSDYWSADIAVARIYNRALSNAEVAQNFDAQKARFGL